MLRDVGVLDALRMKRYQEAITASLPPFASDPSSYPIATPWGSSGNLEKVWFKDVFGTDGPPVNSRRAAMSIPAIARARNQLCTAIAKQPLREARSLTDEEWEQVQAGQLPAWHGVLPPSQQPPWLYRTNRVAPRQQVVWTVDDLIFYGWSCHWVDRGVDGFPLHRERLNIGTWHVDADLNVVVNGTVVQPDSDGRLPVILIPGYHEGILNTDALGDIKAVYDIVRDRLKYPIALTELHQTGGMPLNETEQEELLDRNREQRAKPGGQFSFTSKDIQTIVHAGDAGDQQFLIEARNAAAVDAARLIGIAAGKLDATTPKASLNYETRSGRNQEFREDDTSGYSMPIEDRLSMDDCVPAGSRVVFDATDFTAPVPSPTGAVLED